MLSNAETSQLIEDDKRFIWHPFTQMQDWNAPGHEPIVIVRGEGAWLIDSQGRRYLDGNASIWTNLHGHSHPRITEAVGEQVRELEHCSFLGLTHPVAIKLARKLIRLVEGSGLRRVFFSDNGSTAIEVAIKMAIQYFQQNGKSGKTQFVAFADAYHGDTLGASSLGGISWFHERFGTHHFPVWRIDDANQLEALDGTNVAALVIEPVIQGAAGMRLWPPGMLARLRVWCDRFDAFLIFDEVMTGFGRTGKMFAFEQEGVYPDLLALAKGLTGGCLPLGATLTNERIYRGFLGRYDELRTFFYGHSYCANPLGCAAALASLEVFEVEQTLEQLQPKIAYLAERLRTLGKKRFVYDIRQAGFMAGIEVRDRIGEPFDWREQTGARICAAASQHGLLTRPIRDVLVLMLPFCASTADIDIAIEALHRGIEEVCGG